MLKWKQIAWSNYHYRYHPFPLFVENAKKLGLETVEIWGGSPHFYLDDTAAEGFREERSMLDQAGLHVAAFVPESVSCLYQLCAWNPEVREKAQGYYRLAIDAAVTLGTDTVILSCCGGAKDQPADLAYWNGVHSLRSLAAYAADRGVTLAVQTNCPQDSNILHTHDQLRQFLRDVGAPNVKPALDLCAMAAAFESLEDWFRVPEERPVFIRFSDGRPEGHLVWGEGILPLEDFAERLERLGYTGALGQILAQERYFFQPEEADRRNLDALRPYLLGREAK